jgi:hypothetical protein
VAFPVEERNLLIGTYLESFSTRDLTEVADEFYGAAQSEPKYAKNYFQQFGVRPEHFGVFHKASKSWFGNYCKMNIYLFLRTIVCHSWSPAITR